MDERQAAGAVLEAIAEKELVEFTRTLARIPSVHGDEAVIARAYADRMAAIGLEVETADVEPGRPNVLGWLRGSGGGRSLMLNGHTDTVMHVLGWRHDQYGGELDQGRIYGHGVSNMKASNAAMLFAVEAIRRAGVRLRGDVLIALVVGECQGGVGIRDLMARGVRTDTFICGEPTQLNVLTVHASAQYLQVNIIGRSGHFGTHDHGVNAILKMCTLLRRLGPVHARIPPGRWLSATPGHTFPGLPRYHVGAIKGGITRDLPENGGWSSTPDFCRAIVNVRAGRDKSIESTREDLERVLRAMQERDGDFDFEVTAIRDMPAFESAASITREAVAGAACRVTGRRPRVGPIAPYMFMTSDSGHMQNAGMTDGVLLGPGNFTSSVPDEHVQVDTLIAATGIYAVSAVRICS
jgi:acetylornithine deacetylase